MGASESIHLPHFAGARETMPARIAKSFDFYRDLARFGSCTESGRTRRTPIRCRKRPKRKRCEGLLVVRRSDLPAAVDWECPACSARGRISGWEKTDADLRGLELDRRPMVREMSVSVQAHDALRSIARVDASFLALAFGAEVDDAGQPHIYVDPSVAPRLAPLVVRHGATASSSRAIETLGEVLGALMSAAGDGAFRGLLTGDPEAIEEIAMSLFGTLDDDTTELSRAPRRARAKHAAPRQRREPKTFQIKVTLRDVSPPVWRRLLVPADISLPKLHEVLQAAMGWMDGHLHAFRVGPRVFAPPDDFESLGDDSSRVALDEIAPRKGSRLVYEYDFGDGWTHDILVEDVVDGRCSKSRCLKGRRRCPPEDCGGPWGYAELLEAIADPTLEGSEDLIEWLPDDFDPEEFDLVETDAAVQDVRVS